MDGAGRQKLERSQQDQPRVKAHICRTISWPLTSSSLTGRNSAVRNICRRRAVTNRKVSRRHSPDTIVKQLLSCREHVAASCFCTALGETGAEVENGAGFGAWGEEGVRWGVSGFRESPAGMKRQPPAEHQDSAKEPSHCRL